jgi:spore photoproduct lyase
MMRKSGFLPDIVFIEKTVSSAPLVRRILENCADVPRRIVRDRREVNAHIGEARDPAAEAKKVLYLAPQRGAFVKPCPCTPSYIGCGYLIINSALNCPLDCAYCILQLYLENAPLTVFTNLDRLWRELDRRLARTAGRFVRIGTGELSDSLALDHLTETVGEFVSYFRSRPRAVFELKTKTAAIDGLLRCRPAGNVVVSWSLNPAAVARSDEAGAAPVGVRLEAARELVRHGFSVGFHLDPLILFPGWEENYGRLVEALFRRVPASRIRWLSLGSLRFPPGLKTIIERRFPASRLTLAELLPGRDGKLRYFKPLRLKLYRRVVEMIRSCGGDSVPLYFCMEDSEVWERVLKWRPRRKADVELSLSPRSVGSKSDF